jgi:putative addiction module component (TIGR02574 family)
MMSTEELIEEAVSLPVDIRLRLVERLLESLNPTRADVDELWALEAERRVAQIENGGVEAVPGDEVFSKIRDRLTR